VSVTELMSDVNESLKADEDIISYEELFCESQVQARRTSQIKIVM